LLEGAWRFRHELPLSDALYLELASANGMTLITTDPRLAGFARPVVQLIGG